MDKEFSEQSLKALIASEISDAEKYQGKSYREDWDRSYQYYNGVMSDTPPADGWSKFQTRDVSDVMGWTLPGIIRVFTASNRMVDYQPRQPGDEEFVEQASDYANFIFWNDCDGYRILWDSTHDSLLFGDGIVKTFWDDSEEVSYSTHSGLTVEDLTVLASEEGVEIVSQAESFVAIAGEDGSPMQIPVYDVKIKRTESTGRVRIMAIEPENFLIDRQAVTIEDARFLAHRDPYMTRSGLIKMGFDRELVEGLPGNASDLNLNGMSMRRETEFTFSQGDRSTDRIELYECYVHADVDDDGVSETVLAYYAGNNGAGELLSWEVWDDDPVFSQIPCDPVPHQFASRSLAGEVLDIQQIKTVITRQMLDNAYQVNNPRQDIEAGSIINMDELVNPTVGGVLIRKTGTPPVNYNIVPSIMPNALAALEHMDKVTEMRTGVSRSTMALDPNTLQNQTATASNNQRDSAYSQIELIARNQAELGWKKVFAKILKLIVKHQDSPRMIRLRDEWVPMDPRSWNAGMDAQINVGLGTGSRDRDMAMLQNIFQTQMILTEQVSSAQMPQKALEMLPKIVKTAVKIAESAGIPNASDFYPELDDQDVKEAAQKAEQASSQPSPEQQVAEAKMQADMQVQQFKAQADMQKAQSEQQIKLYQIDQEMQLRRYQIDQELQLKRDQLISELQLKQQMGFIKGATDAARVSSDVNVGGDPG